MHTIRRGVRSSQHCCRVCWFASNADTHYIEQPREPLVLQLQLAQPERRISDLETERASKQGLTALCIQALTDHHLLTATVGLGRVFVVWQSREVIIVSICTGSIRSGEQVQ